MPPGETRRVCAGCGAVAAGLFPTGWVIEPVREPIGPRFAVMVVGERPVCLDCQHPELADVDKGDSP